MIMPQLITHNIFSKEVYKELNTDIKNSIRNDVAVYKMFSQSFDNFIYYFSFNIKNMKRVRKLSKRGHKSNVKYCNVVAKRTSVLNTKILELLLSMVSEFIYPYKPNATGVFLDFMISPNPNPLCLYKSLPFKPNQLVVSFAAIGSIPKYFCKNVSDPICS